MSADAPLPSPLPTDLAERVRLLGYRARGIAEGLLSGAHRSPHRGASVVFVEHREYRPGDDLRLLDWRAAARTDRLVVKRFEQETQLRAHLVLDRSASMAFPEPIDDPTRKVAHGATLLAALAYLLLRQGDAVGVATFDDALGEPLPPRSRPAHLDLILERLATAMLTPTGDAVPRTAVRRSLLDLAERIGRRGLVVVASDLLDEDEEAVHALGLLTARGHEVIVFQVLTASELDVGGLPAARYRGLEGEASLESDPVAVAEEYRNELAALLDDRRRRCLAVGARWVLARTDAAAEVAIAEALDLPGPRSR